LLQDVNEPLTADHVDPVSGRVMEEVVRVAGARHVRLPMRYSLMLQQAISSSARAVLV
jgi:hypothetical protein